MEIIIVSKEKNSDIPFGRKRRNTYFSIAFSDKKMNKVLIGDKYGDVWNSTLKDMALFEIRGIKEANKELKEIKIEEIKRGLGRNDIYTDIINTAIENANEKDKFIKIWPKICEKVETIKNIAKSI